MDYLRSNASASATGLFVICRHLAEYEAGRAEDDMRRALQLLRSATNSSDNAAAVLTASLAVGEGLGLLRKDDSTHWHVDREIGALVNSKQDAWPGFRAELLHRVATRGDDGDGQESRAPDLVRGLTWLMQLSPLSPVGADWSRGPERLVDELGLDAVTRSEQWRPFVRWAVALGLARRSDASRPKVLIPDASTAISDQLHSLPRTAPAREWISSLRERLPVLGSPSLTSQLPQGRHWEEIPPALVLGLLKLERYGVLELEPSDDAADIVAIGLGSSHRQIGVIKSRGGHA